MFVQRSHTSIFGFYEWREICEVNYTTVYLLWGVFFRLQRPTNMDSLLIFNTLHTRLHFDLFRKTWWMLEGNRKKSLNRKQRPEGIRNTQNFMALATHNWFPNFYLKSWPERIWWFIWDLTINFLSIQESFWNCKNLHNDY